MVLQKLEQASYDLICLDSRMPGMSGIRLYEIIISKWPELADKVIFITGDTSDNGIEEYLNNHNLLYITKPFDRKTLEDKVITLLSR